MSMAQKDPVSPDASSRKRGRTHMRAGLTPEHARAGQIWVPPSESLATRKISMRSKASFRGTLINVRTHREIHYESVLERDAYYIAMADPRNVLIHDQPPPVQYETADGKLRQHWFDILITRQDGLRTAIDIKPARMVERSGILGIHRLIARQNRDFGADVMALRTEKQITRLRAKNAQYIVWALANSTPSDRTAARLKLESIGGRATIGDVVSQGDGSPTFRAAVVSLLGMGEAQVDQERLINDYSTMTLIIRSSEGGSAQ